MPKPYYLATTIFGAVAALVLQAQITIAALPSKELGKLAGQITVRILTPGSQGSGIIIDKNGNTYKVLTARHVVDSINPGEESDIETFDEQLHAVNTQNIQSFGDKWDLAVVEFTTTKSYQVGEMGDSSSLSVGQNIYVSGFPIATAAMTAVTLNFTEGKLTAVSSKPFDDGYGLAYNNNTLPGMSGGVVLDEEGLVVGVHGKADVIETRETADPNIRIKSGNNLAIPINYYLGLTKQIDLDPNALANQETTADDYYVQAAQKSLQKDYEGAVSSLDQAITLNPAYDDAYAHKGLANYKLKKYDQAISDCNKAIAINPLSVTAFNNRGAVYSLLNKPGLAKADQDLALILLANLNVIPTIFPGVVSFQSRLPSGVTFRNCARGVNECLSRFPHLQRNLQVIGDNDGVPLDKSEGYAYYNRAIAYLNLQRYAEARENLQQSANLYQKQGSKNIAQRIINFLNQLPN